MIGTATTRLAARRPYSRYARFPNAIPATIAIRAFRASERIRLRRSSDAAMSHTNRIRSRKLSSSRVSAHPNVQLILKNPGILPKHDRPYHLRSAAGIETWCASLPRKGRHHESCISAGPDDLRRFLPLQRNSPLPGEEIDGTVRRLERYSHARSRSDRHRGAAGRRRRQHCARRETKAGNARGHDLPCGSLVDDARLLEHWTNPTRNRRR